MGPKVGQNGPKMAKNELSCLTSLTLGADLGIYSRFGPISAVSDPPGVIPSHIWIIMDPSWGSWGRLDDFSNFTLFLERLKVAVTGKIRKMTKNELS